MPDQGESPAARMRRLVDGFQVSQAIAVAASLGVADELRGGPRTARELATAVGAHERSLYRLLRALAASGVFFEGEDGRFALTDLGECLCSDAPLPVGPWARQVGRPYFWEAWGNLLHSIKTGENAFRALHDDQPVWEWRAARPEESAIFDRAMQGVARRQVQAFLEVYDFGRFNQIVDVGGGNGALLAMVLRTHPRTRGLLFDQPHVVELSGPLIEAADIAGRCEAVAGSFFESVPPGADAYVMKSILHDWEDEDCIRILQTIRTACTAPATLLVLEWVVGPPNTQDRARYSDLNMLVMPGGQERTEGEWKALLGAGGFELRRVIPSAAGQSVIECIPA